MSAADIRAKALELAVAAGDFTHAPAFDRFINTGHFVNALDEEPEIDNTDAQSTSTVVDLDKKTSKRSRRKGQNR